MAAAIIQREAYLISSRTFFNLNPAALNTNKFRSFLSLHPDDLNVNKMIVSRRSHGSTAKFLSSPQPAFCDDVISLRFSGLPASSKVKLSCSLVRQEDSIDMRSQAEAEVRQEDTIDMRSQAEAEVRQEDFIDMRSQAEAEVLQEDTIDMRSQAEFVTDPSGCLDLSSSHSLGPSYHGMDPMGMFWSMDSWGNKEYQDINQIMEPLSYNLTLTGGKGDTILNAIVKRKLANDGVTKIPVHERGLIGSMFVPAGKGPFPAVLTVHGGRGLKEDLALYLANHGFATLAVAFYGLSGLPRTYRRINIEYFEQAVDFLQEQAFVAKHEGIGLFGFSKGGDITLSMASFLPKRKVSAVATVATAITSMAGSTSYKGLTIPAHGFRENSDKPQLPVVRKNTVSGFDVMTPLENVPECRVPFHQSDAALLFIAGEDDGNWDSCKFAREAKRTCEERGKENIEVQTYSGLGHLFMTPYSPVCVSQVLPGIPEGTQADMGGSNKKEHTRSQIKAWRKIVNFFNMHLK